MKTCSVCGQTYSDRIDFCFSDGAVLTEVTALDSVEPGSAIDAPMPRAMGGLLDARTPVPRSRRRSLIGSSAPIPGIPNLHLAAEDAPPLPEDMDLPTPLAHSSSHEGGADFMPRPLAPLPVPESSLPEPKDTPPQVPLVCPPASEPPPEAPPLADPPAPTPEVVAPRAEPPASEVPELPPSQPPQEAALAPEPQPESDRGGIPMLWIGVIVGTILIVFIGILAVLALGGVGVFAVSSTGGRDAQQKVETTSPPPPIEQVETPRPAPDEAPEEEPEVVDTDDEALVESEDTESPDEPADPEPIEASEILEPEPQVSTAQPIPTEPAVAAVDAPEPGSPWGAPEEGAADAQLVSIRSNPAGAEVVIDGTKRGTTPLEITLDHGTYSVQIGLSGYKATTETLRVLDGVGSLDVTLTTDGESGPVMVVFPGRDGYTLEIDGEPRGTLPARATLSAGSHDFTVRGEAGVFQVTRDVVFGDGTPVINLAE